MCKAVVYMYLHIQIRGIYTFFNVYLKMCIYLFFGSTGTWSKSQVRTDLMLDNVRQTITMTHVRNVTLIHDNHHVINGMRPNGSE